MDIETANRAGFMTNTQALAYAEYGLCGFVESGQIDAELLGNMLREIYWAFDMLTLREVEARAKERRGKL